MTSLRRRELSLIVTLLLGIVGCIDGDESGPRSSSRTTNTADAPPRDNECTETHPDRLQVLAQSSEEIPYLAKIIACTNQLRSSMSLANNTDLVWTISSKTRATVTQLDDGASFEFDSFKAFASSIYPNALLFPHSTVTITARPEDVSWFIYGGMSASWIVHHRVAETLQGLGVAAVIDVLSGESLGRKGLLTCLNSAFGLAGTDLDELVGPEPFSALLEGLGAASSVTACGSALLKARDDQSTRLGRGVSRWTDDVARWADDLAFLERSNTLLDDAARLIKIALHA